MAQRPLDVLVIGGGITGSGVALDAASRGLSVGLVEREDFAAGTSGRSSRLIHGGPRYLRRLEFGLVYESLRERWLLMRLAPHLVRPLPFLVPVVRPTSRLVFGTGFTIYDLLATGRNISRHRWVQPEEAAALVPGLARSTGGFVYWDCRTDDARLTLEVARRAAAFGALVANHAEVTELLGEGRVRGARVTDRESGETMEVRARVTVNAAGAWAGQVHALASATGPRLRPSKGVHVVLDRAAIPIRSALLIPSVAGEGSMVFVIPWGPRVFAGTTDTAYGGPLEDPPVDRADLDVVVGSVARAFGDQVSTEDVRASWAGVRPLLDTGGGSTRDLSRRHVVLEGIPGLVTVTGGKLTTYRAMAQHVVDRVCRRLGTGGKCRTHSIFLGLSSALAAEVARAKDALAELSPDPWMVRRLVERYGEDWNAAAELIREDPTLGEPAVDGLPVLRVELSLARTREMALTEEDVLARRTRLSTMDQDAAAAVSGSRRTPRR